MRPTGKLHLGNYMGALANWVKLQDQYECYFFIADWHALTSDYAEALEMSHRIIVMCEGRVTGELTAAEANQEKIMTFATQREAAA